MSSPKAVKAPALSRRGLLAAPVVYAALGTAPAMLDTATAPIDLEAAAAEARDPAVIAYRNWRRARADWYRLDRLDPDSKEADESMDREHELLGELLATTRTYFAVDSRVVSMS